MIAFKNIRYIYRVIFECNCKKSEFQSKLSKYCSEWLKIFKNTHKNYFFYKMKGIKFKIPIS